VQSALTVIEDGGNSVVTLCFGDHFVAGDGPSRDAFSAKFLAYNKRLTCSEDGVQSATKTLEIRCALFHWLNVYSLAVVTNLLHFFYRSVISVK
jgi:hypothetical protein